MKKVLLFAVAMCTSGLMIAQPKSPYQEKIVYEGPDVVFRQIDEQTWVGNGHLMANESVYLIAGNDQAILLDAGTDIKGLKKIAEGICRKPVTLERLCSVY